jgi:DNA invertase Pin-like site-specific DNA recombinase
MAQAYSYVRFSSAQQEGNDSVRRQVDKTRDWCSKNGISLDESTTLEDLGVSAFTGKNLKPESGLGGFLEGVKTGKIPRGSYLVIERLDRFSRAEIDTALTLFMGLLRSGIKIVTVDNGTVYDERSLNSIADLVIVLLGFATANQESAKKSDRIRDEWEQRRKNVGDEKLTAWCPAWLELNEDRKTFRVKKNAKETILYIFAEYLKGTGVLTIAKKLNAKDEPVIVRETKRNIRKKQSWKAHNIQKLLRNKALIGHLQPTRLNDRNERVAAGPVITDYYPTIVSEETFFKVQAKLEAIPPKRGNVSEKQSNLFTGLLRCPYCEGRMDIFFSYPSRKTKDGVHKYKPIRNVKCVNAVSGKCIPIGWRLEELEESFLKFALEVKTQLKEQNNTTNLQEGIDVAKKTLADRKSRLQRFLEMIEGGESVPKTMMTRMNELEEQITKGEEDLKKQESALILSKQKNPLNVLDTFNQDLKLTDKKVRNQVAGAVQSTFSKIDVFFAGDPEHAKQVQNAAKRMEERGEKRSGRAAMTFRSEWNIDTNRFFVAHLKVPGHLGRFTYPRIDVVESELKQGQEFFKAWDQYGQTKYGKGQYTRSVIPNKEALLEDLRNGMTLKVACHKYSISMPTASLFRQFHKMWRK